MADKEPPGTMPGSRCRDSIEAQVARRPSRAAAASETILGSSSTTRTVVVISIAVAE
jgi:hypothetical protein